MTSPIINRRDLDFLLYEFLDVERFTARERQLANARHYLDMFGHRVIAWMWLRQGLAAARGLKDGGTDSAFYRGKLSSCRYFFQVELPKVDYHADILRRAEDTVLTTDPDWL